MTESTSKPPLTLAVAAELIARMLKHGHADDNLVVGYDPGFATMGGSPAMPVTGINAGFDWDRGKVFLKTERDLGPAGDDLKSLRDRLHETGETLAWINMQLKDSRLSDEQKLKAIGETMAAHRKKISQRANASSSSSTAAKG